ILRPETLDVGQGIGTGSLREHIDALVAGGATLVASGMSSKARGLGPDALGDLPVTMAMPDRLVELTFAADRVRVYGPTGGLVGDERGDRLEMLRGVAAAATDDRCPSVAHA